MKKLAIILSLVSIVGLVGCGQEPQPKLSEVAVEEVVIEKEFSETETDDIMYFAGRAIAVSTAIEILEEQDGNASTLMGEVVSLQTEYDAMDEKLQGVVKSLLTTVKDMAADEAATDVGQLGRKLNIISMELATGTDENAEYYTDTIMILAQQLTENLLIVRGGN